MGEIRREKGKVDFVGSAIKYFAAVLVWNHRCLLQCSDGYHIIRKRSRYPFLRRATQQNYATLGRKGVGGGQEILDRKMDWGLTKAAWHFC